MRTIAVLSNRIPGGFRPVLVSLGLTLLMLAQGRTASFVDAGTMSVPREWHTATRLTNGLVLVAGGYPDGESCEIYDPTLKKWNTTDPFGDGRGGHTATLLTNGLVLAAGGDFLGVTCELFNPAAGRWTPTDSLQDSRYAHTATLLTNGQVLVAGGLNEANEPLSSAELYDPDSGRWTPTEDMLETRANHTATLLPNGQVLVVGGNDADLRTAELYDPESRTWTRTASMGDLRYMHSATLLKNGWVLVAGGAFSRDPPDHPPSSELYDPSTGTWTNAGWMITSTSREKHSATLLGNGLVLVAGGAIADGLFFSDSSAELFNPETRKWTTAGRMTVRRELHTATLLADGTVLIVGGFNNFQTELASTERYVAVPTPTQLVLPRIGEDGWFRFQFTNTPGLLFHVLVTTNPASPITKWTRFNGVLWESAAGSYEFSDYEAPTTPMRFYLLSSP